ncbi:polyketide synthase [Mycolicibacterium sp. XJ870]
MAAPLMTSVSGVTCWIADHATSAPPRPSDVTTLSESLDSVLAAELDGAPIALGCSTEDLLLAALGRTVARTIGDGMLVVELDATSAAPCCVAIPCVSKRQLSGSELLAATRSGAGNSTGYSRADVAFGYSEGAVRPAVGQHVLAVHVHRGSDDDVRVDWSYDARSFDRYTVAELAEQFPLALIEVTSG